MYSSKMKKCALSFLLFKANISTKSKWLVNVSCISLKLYSNKNFGKQKENNIPAIKI